MNAFFGSGAFTPLPDKPDVVYSSQSSTDTDFGRSIAVLWDIDENGLKDVVIGASQASMSAVDDMGMGDMIDCGRLYVFGNSPDPSQTPPTVLAKIDGEPNSGRFATTLIPVDDMDGDGVRI